MPFPISYVLTNFLNVELDPGKDSCPDMLAALTSAAAPWAMGTLTHVLPCANSDPFCGFPGAGRCSVSAQVASIHRELWSVGGGTGNLAAGMEHSIKLFNQSSSCEKQPLHWRCF